MYLIEPCCAQRHLREVRHAIKDGGTTEIEGYGDLSLAELLEPLVARYNGVELLIVAPALPDQAAEALAKWMKLTWARMDGRGHIWRITHLTIVANLTKKRSPMASAWKKDNPWGERLTMIHRQQEDTAIVLPDFAIEGPVNMQYGHHFTATATTDPERISALRKRCGASLMDNG